MNIYNPSFPNEPDWARVEQELYSKCCHAITRFNSEHPDTLCSSFGFYLQPDYTSLFIALDTYNYSIRNAQRLEAEELERRRSKFSGARGWDGAAFTLIQNQSYIHNPNTSDFEYWDFESMELEGWEEILDVFLAELPPENDPDYKRQESAIYIAHENFMSGHATAMFWRVFERLIKEQEINKLNLSTPFRLGFDFHDAGPMVVVRILNWPEAV